MIFEILIWSGAAISIAGLAAILWCILTVVRLKRAGIGDAEMRQRMKTVVVVNMAALALSVSGLILVVLAVVFRP
ncbi:hypothetical protein [Paracoccus pacificus]|uniref:Uncharacterized protein n=1 Tax=Paracoccus pacificus TaxID=1463598 RepID=A0ABW4R9G6_9RHOB